MSNVKLTLLLGNAGVSNLTIACTQEVADQAMDVWEDYMYEDQSSEEYRPNPTIISIEGVEGDVMKFTCESVLGFIVNKEQVGTPQLIVPAGSPELVVPTGTVVN